MPNTIAVTGLHTPITNIAPTETTVITAVISPGSIGFGEEAAVEEGALVEAIQEPEFEAALGAAVEHAAPDLSNLEDIGVASFGPPPQLEAVIGTDERVRITTTQQYPWRVNASLLITAADNSQWIGTGWFISPRTLVTAGHCVFIKHSGVPGRDGWVKKIQVMPGRNGAEVPFGGMSATEFWTVQGWGDKGLENYDYGAIILPSAFPQELGFYAFGVFDNEKLLTATANIAGYPGDKPRGTLWYDNRKVGSVNPDKVFYAADTAGGQSGACVYIFHEGQRTGIAVHAYGGNTANSGTRISSQVFANLESWKRTQEIAVTTIQGHVVDPQGRPVAEATVYIVSAPANMPDIAQLTDDQGKFTISAPVPGRYTVGVRSDSWGSAQTDVEVRGEEPVSVEVLFNSLKEKDK